MTCARSDRERLRQTVVALQLKLQEQSDATRVALARAPLSAAEELFSDLAPKQDASAAQSGAVLPVEFYYQLSAGSRARRLCAAFAC